MTPDQIYAAAEELEVTLRGFLDQAIRRFTADPVERGSILLAVLTLALRRYLHAFKSTRKDRAAALGAIETAVMQD